MINNGTLHYDHDRDGTHTQIAGCEANFRNSEKDTHIAIRYENDILTGNFIADLLFINVFYYSFLIKLLLFYSFDGF